MTTAFAAVEDALKDYVASLVADLLSQDVSGDVATKKPSRKVDAEVDVETGEVTLDRDEVESLSIVDLRKLAKENGIDLKKKADILAAFEENGFFSESDEDEADDEDVVDVEDDDEDDDEDEEDGYSREDLEEKTLRELKKIAKEEGHEQDEIKGLDQDGLIDLILGDDEEEDDDEDEEDEDDEDEEDGDEDEDEDEEAEDEVVIDRATLNGMSDAELKNIVKQFDIKLPKKANRKTIIQTILDAAEDEDDD